MVIRQVKVEDAQKMLDYLSELRAEECDTIFYRESIPSLEEEKEWLANMTGENAILLVAEVNDRVIASIGGHIPKQVERQHTIEFGMSVLLPFRGRGIGRRLVESFLEWAAGKKIRIVELFVFSHNVVGIGLYTSMGFKEDGRIKNGIKLRDGQLSDLIHMSRHHHEP